MPGDVTALTAAYKSARLKQLVVEGVKVCRKAAPWNSRADGYVEKQSG